MLFDAKLRADEELQALVVRLREDVRLRFAPLRDGLQLALGSTWPTSWQMQTPDRAELLGSVSLLTDNSTTRWGVVPAHLRSIKALAERLAAPVVRAAPSARSI